MHGGAGGGVGGNIAGGEKDYLEVKDLLFSLVQVKV